MSTAPFSLLYVALTAMLALAPLTNVEGATKITTTSETTRPFSTEGSIQIENVNGSITVMGWDRPQLKVEITKKAKFQEDHDGIVIQEKASEEHLSIKTQIKSKRRGFLGLTRKSSTGSVTYRIWAPRTARLEEIRSTNGSVNITQMEAEVNAQTVNGPADASGLAGPARISTVNGSISAQYNRTLDSGSIELESVNGRIQLSLPEDTNATVRAKTTNGNIENDFGLGAKKRFPIGRDLNGDIGGGGIKLRLKTVNGSIDIKKLENSEVRAGTASLKG